MAREVDRVGCGVEDVAESGGVHVGCVDSCALDRCSRGVRGEFNDGDVAKTAAVRPEGSAHSGEEKDVLAGILCRHDSARSRDALTPAGVLSDASPAGDAKLP